MTDKIEKAEMQSLKQICEVIHDSIVKLYIDPTPISEQSEYCEEQFDIDKLTAETTVIIL